MLFSCNEYKHILDHFTLPVDPSLLACKLEHVSNSDSCAAIAFQQLNIVENGSVAEKSQNAYVSAVKRPPHLQSKVSNKTCAHLMMLSYVDRRCISSCLETTEAYCNRRGWRGGTSC